MLSDSPIDARGSQISPGLAQRSHGSSGSVAVGLDGIAVRIAHIDGRGAAPDPDGRRKRAEPSLPGRRGCAHGCGRRAAFRLAFAARRAMASRSTVAAPMGLLLFLFLPTLFLMPMTGASVLQGTDDCRRGAAHARSARASSR